MGLWLMNLGSAPAASPTGTVAATPTTSAFLLLATGVLELLIGVTSV